MLFRSKENKYGSILDVAKRHGEFPVIVAGGIYTHDDIVRYLDMGAGGVQLGIRFLATEESSASLEYKQSVINASREDIVLAIKPGSPCGLPFRVIKQSGMYEEALRRGRNPKCDKGFVLQKDEKEKFTRCPAKESNKKYFCICNGLLSSAGYNPGEEKPLYTVGTNAHRIERIMSVGELMDELKGAS